MIGTFIFGNHLSDITSGYNVAKDVTHLDEYHDLCGFTAAELAEAVASVLAARSLPADRAPGILDLLQSYSTTPSTS